MHRAMGQHRQRKEKQGWSLQPRETDHRDQGKPGRVGQMLSSESTKRRNTDVEPLEPILILRLHLKCKAQAAKCLLDPRT